MKKIQGVLPVILCLFISLIPVQGFSEAPFSVSIEKTDHPINYYSLTVEDAVRIGLENSLDMKTIDNKIELARVAQESAYQNEKDLRNAERKIEKAKDKLEEKEDELSDAISDLNEAQNALDHGIAPKSIPLTDASGNPVIGPDGNRVIIPAGTNISQFLSAIGLESAASLVISSVQRQLDRIKDQIDTGEQAISEGEKTISLNETLFENIMKSTSGTVESKIDFGSAVELSVDDAGLLMTKMAGVNLQVTQYARAIYKNQIAMLIKKSYYDVLYAQLVTKLKEKAMERGETQLNMVRLSFDNGMKAKDDYLLAGMYYDSTVIAWQQAEADYQNALNELKKNMNIPFESSVILKDSMAEESVNENVYSGIQNGLKNRLEIQQALGRLQIYELNEEIIDSMHYDEDDYELQEASLLKEQAQLSLEAAKSGVENEIRQSYKTMTAAGNMLTASKELIGKAREVVDIARLKYEQGFGAENSLLKQLNLEESSGTVIELISAQEKLAEVEANVAKITYGYTMARVKYLNDAGILEY